MMFGLGLIRDINPFEIIRHPWFISAFFAGGLAQLIKFTVVAIRLRRFDFPLLWSAGGMPSAHAALVTALAVSVGLTEGFDSHEAMIAVGFGTIVLADAATLRRAAGDQAALLNRIVDRLGGPEKFGVKRLRERLGHTRREVVGGVLFGMAVAYVVCRFWDFWK
jgi:acid phosphatase family membrane protein YuiD